MAAPHQAVAAVGSLRNMAAPHRGAGAEGSLRNMAAPHQAVAAVGSLRSLAAQFPAAQVPSAVGVRNPEVPVMRHRVPRIRRLGRIPAQTLVEPEQAQKTLVVVLAHPTDRGIPRRVAPIPSLILQARAVGRQILLHRLAQHRGRDRLRRG